MITTLFTNTLWRFNEVLFSPTCLVCQSYSLQTLCHRCELSSTVTNCSGTRCDICFERILSGNLCGICQTRPPTYNKSRFLWDYYNNARDFCVALKYKPSLKLINFAAIKFAEEIPDLFEIYDWNFIIPIPASETGLKKRGFNHVELLAQKIKKELKIKSNILNALEHKTKRKAQASLSNAARLSGLQRRYGINPINSQLLENKQILLLDDVTTTGATINAAIEALKSCNLARLDVLTLCRSPTWFMFRNQDAL